MGKTFKLIYIIAAMSFLLAAVCFFLEKNDFLGEVIDAKIVKTKIKQDPYFENSLFKTENQGKSRFRRMDLSSLISDKKFGKEVFKFQIIKEKQAMVDKSLSNSKFLFAAITIFMLIAAIMIIVFKRFYILAILEVLSAVLLIYYDKLLAAGVRDLGLEKKIYEMWGVAESIQHLAIFGLILFTIVISVVKMNKVRKIFIFEMVAVMIAILYKKFISIKLIEVISNPNLNLNLDWKKRIINVIGTMEIVLAVIIIVAILITIIISICIMIKKEEKQTIGENMATMKKSIKITLADIKKHKFAYKMLTPAIIVVILIIIYPFLYNFRISFSNLNLKRFVSFVQGDKLYFTGMANFVEIFMDKSFWLVLARTVIWTFCNIIFHVLGGVTLAILLNREMKLRPVYQTLLILPWAIPQFIAVLVWKGMYNSDYGAVNVILSKVVNTIDPGIIKNIIETVPLFGKILKVAVSNNIEATTVVIPWLTDPIWAFTGAVITNIWLGIPFMMMIALGGLQSIPETFYEAAEIDGASAWQKIRHITIPQLKPVMTPAIVMGIVWTFNNLNVIYLLTTDSLTGKVDILVTYVYKAAFNLYRYGYAAAFSVIIFVILMVFSVIMIKTTKAEEGV